MQKKCFILKFEPLMELQMTDGGKTTRLGDIQTGVENVMEKIRESKGEKKPSYLGFALFLTFALACDNHAFKMKCMFLSSVKITA